MLKINSLFKLMIMGLAIVATFSMIVAPNAYALGESNARSLGMGGAYTAVARNYNSLQYNPANLGLRDESGFAFELFSVGAQLRNNSFSFGDYNKYTGAHLTAEDKAAILSKVPADGLSMQALAQGGASSFSMGRFAFSASGYAASSVTLPKDPFELILYGNAVKPNLDLNSVQGEAWGSADFALGYAHRLREWEDGEFSIGIGAHYLRGLVYQKIISAEGYAETGDTAITAAGNMTLLSAMGGAGYSMDLGMATRFETDYVFSFSLLNLINQIQWQSEPELTYYEFRLEPLNANSMDNDSITVSNDTTVAAESFSSKKPTIARMGLSWSGDNLTWAVDYEQGFINAAGSSMTPCFSSGLEYRKLSWLPLRAGFSLGGLMGGYAATGFGFVLGPYNLDFALANQGAILPNGSKGLLFSLSSNFNF